MRRSSRGSAGAQHPERRRRCRDATQARPATTSTNVPRARKATCRLRCPRRKDAVATHTTVGDAVRQRSEPPVARRRTRLDCRGLRRPLRTEVGQVRASPLSEGRDIARHHDPGGGETYALSHHEHDQHQSQTSAPRRRAAGLLVRTDARAWQAQPLPSVWRRKRDPLSSGAPLPSRLAPSISGRRDRRPNLLYPLWSHHVQHPVE
jgi:hypothetical protein